MAAEEHTPSEGADGERGGVATAAPPGTRTDDDRAPARASLRTRRPSAREVPKVAVEKLTATELEGSGWRHWARLPGLLFPLGLFVAWRLIQLGITLHQGGSPVHLVFQYDGSRYLQIIHQGYAAWWVQMPNTAFFPLLSWIARPLTWVFGDFFVAHLMATVTGLAAFVTVWGVTKVWRDEATARKAVFLLALFPASVFLTAFYSEGLFIALGAGAAWADRRNRRLIASLCMFGVAATRSIGILIPAVIVLVRLLRNRRIDRTAVQYTASAVAGLGSVMFVMGFETGDPLAFMKVQGDWGRSISWPWTAVMQGWHNLWPDERTILVPTLIARNLDLYCVAIVLFAIGYTAWGARRKRGLFPLETPLLGIVLISLPLFSSILASFNRFTLANWVIYPAWATWAQRQRPWVRRTFMVAVTIALGYVTWVMAHQVADGRYVA